jgi:hypothetical protein
LFHEISFSFLAGIPKYMSPTTFLRSMEKKVE